LRIELEGHVNGHMGRRYLKLAAKTNPERKAYKNGKELSLARAETVRDYLVSYGINADRIVCIGKGGTEKRFKRPKNSRENEANRRIEINILK
jgi:flagellar motor protein MotB